MEIKLVQNKSIENKKSVNIKSPIDGMFLASQTF